MKGYVVITGGGTGGHLKVAKEFVDEFYSRGTSPIFIGSKNGQDKQWFEKDYHLKKAVFLDTKGVVNKSFFGKLSSLWNIMKETKKCMDIYDRVDVKTVISVGGFSAAPASFAAILTSGCKLYIHEQNSHMGKLNQITSKFATEVFSSYDENSPVKDYPVSEVFFDKARVRNELKTIIFLGGSQGASAINDFALQMAYNLDQLGIKIIHQTGKNDFQRVKDAYEELHLEQNIDVFDFCDDIASKMAEADFAVSRAGASTLWELTANALPTLFVPYPYAAADHQFSNAKYLKNKQMCYVSREKHLNWDFFKKCLDSNLEEMSKGLVELISSGATRTMVDYVSYKNQKD